MNYLSIHDTANTTMQGYLAEIEEVIAQVIKRDFENYIDAVEKIEFGQKLCIEAFEYVRMGYTHDPDDILKDIFEEQLNLLEVYKSNLLLMNSGA